MVTFQGFIVSEAMPYYEKASLIRMLRKNVTCNTFCPILYHFCPPKWENGPFMEITADINIWQPVVKELHRHSLRKNTCLQVRYMKPISENNINLLLVNYIQAIKSFNSLKFINLSNIVTWNCDLSQFSGGKAQIITHTLPWLGVMPLTRCCWEVSNYACQQRCFRWKELQKYQKKALFLIWSFTPSSQATPGTVCWLGHT